MEKFLTMPPEQFNKFLRDTPNPIEAEKDPRREAYRYSKVRLNHWPSFTAHLMFPQSNKFVMRSQLDCQDSRLPGTGVFDLKTRAALPIRLDMLNYQVSIHLLLWHTPWLTSAFRNIRVISSKHFKDPWRVLRKNTTTSSVQRSSSTGNVTLHFIFIICHSDLQ